MKCKIIILVFVMLIINLQTAMAEENEYGIVKAWFNGENATLETVEGIKLEIGKPMEVKVEVTSKIKGHVFIALTEPGITKAFNVLNGPSKQDERIDNLNIISGWSKTYTWTVAPNGAWKNGNAPINIYVGFYNTQSKEDKVIRFTIANPYILDEQYSGSGSTPAQTSVITPGASVPKEAPYVPAIAALAVMMAVWWWRRR